MQTHSEHIDKIVEALAKAQSEITVAIYDSTNPHFKSKYASYEAIRKACLLPLSRNGMCITHCFSVEEGKRTMVTQLSHTSGQWFRSSLSMPQEKETPQSIGSSATYAKRYTLGALLAISSDEDDDGERAEAIYRQTPKPVALQTIPTDPEPMISLEDAYNIDRDIQLLISKTDPEYRQRALKVLGVASFDQVPASNLKRIQSNVEKKAKEIKDSHPAIREDEIPF